MSIRGLPDERPRPSVANLIGRFEQRASKRQSSVGPGGSGASASPTASPSQSRSTSVVSHTTGDSAVIEAKERREWPPQQFKNINNSSFGNVTNGSGSGNDGLPTNAPSTTFNIADLRRSLEKTAVGDSMRGVVKSPPLNSSDDVHAPPLSASVESEAKLESSPVVEEVKSSAEKKENTQAATPMRAAGKVTASKSSNTSSTHSGARASATGKTAATPRPSAISQSKSTSSAPSAAKTSTSTSPAARPLTVQRTGNSAAGAAARAGAKSPPVSTPSRAKTPTARGLRASTSGPHLKTTTSAVVDRAKTPTASPARAKTPTASASLSAVKHTPSSGLYAPTKASLARARNAEAPPPPVPKPAVSVSSLERLMKPTAASASKVRGPAPVPTSPPRAPPAGKNVKMTPTSPPTKGKTLKPRVGLAPARLKEERERKEKEKVATATVGTSAAVAAMAGAAAVIEPTAEDGHGHEHEHEQEQPSFISTTGVSDTSLNHEKEHEEEEPDHAGPPSDIESYDDAFASDDERALELDQAHLMSARPSAEGDKEPFIGTLEVPEVLPVEELSETKVAVEEHESEIAPAADPAPVPAEEEEVVQAVPHSELESELVKEELGASGPAESEPEPASEAEHPNQTEDSSVGHELEPKVEAEATDPATPAASASMQNGLSIVPEPETTEFDSVLNMLAVKPPASPVSIPDEEL